MFERPWRHDVPCIANSHQRISHFVRLQDETLGVPRIQSVAHLFDRRPQSIYDPLALFLQPRTKRQVETFHTIGRGFARAFGDEGVDQIPRPVELAKDQLAPKNELQTRCVDAEHAYRKGWLAIRNMNYWFSGYICSVNIVELTLFSSCGYFIGCR